MDIMGNGQFGVQNILKMYEKGMSIQNLKKIERLKQSSNQGEQLAFGIINAVVNNPNLKMRLYPMKEFKAVQGEIHLLGISPFNDEHLWNAIINNSSIYEIVYYYHSETAQKEMKEHFLIQELSICPILFSGEHKLYIAEWFSLNENHSAFSISGGDLIE